jgi:phosphatidylglycerophosphate synthase
MSNRVIAKSGEEEGMFDARVRGLIEGPLNTAGRLFVRLGIAADVVTVTGFLCGLSGAVAIIFSQYWVALGLILLGRVLDGLDGAIARASKPTDRGGFLDIALDFIFYGAIPLAFAMQNPYQNALPAAGLLASFYANGSVFLAFAVMAQKRGLETKLQGEKSLYYLAGLAEGAETIAVFVAFCLFPQAFPVLAGLFALVCYLSAAARVILAWRMLA